MKVVVIGATGTIGKAVVSELSARHDLICVGKSSGELQCDITDGNSIRALFQKLGSFDALISTTGSVHFAPLGQMNASHFQIGLDSKLMGQVNLVLIGREFIKDGGSFTLTSGILSHDPIKMGASASLVNGALDSFVIAAAVELPRGLRINCVSPTVLTESMKEYAPFFRGFESVSAARVALAYSKSAEGSQTGQIYRVV